MATGHGALPQDYITKAHEKQRRQCVAPMSGDRVLSDVVLEGEVLHVAVDTLELAVLEDGKPDVQDTVLVLRVLHDQEEAEVAGLKRIIVIARDVTYVDDDDKYNGNHYNDDDVYVDVGSGSNLSSLHDGLCDLLPALVEDYPAVRHDHQQQERGDGLKEVMVKVVMMKEEVGTIMMTVMAEVLPARQRDSWQPGSCVG